MKLSKIFLKTIPHMKTSEEGMGNRFICLAIKWKLENDVPFKDRLRATQVIADRLGHNDEGEHTVESWLLERGYITSSEWTPEIAQYRISWLKALAEEYRLKGD